ncbi:MAG TPA: SUF system Fe-S cluster assembly regulator [Gammaproteobacteria bacterium]|nr:SUF system Fe-S cluster assembly regulator [Gammaproteobacteria bacterium]
MLKISKLTDYGTVVMAGLAAQPERLVKSIELAEEVGVAHPTVSKLLKMLNRAGLVESARGVNGGYRLARSPEQIPIAEIIQALEGPLALTECSADEGNCEQADGCSVRVNWQRISRVVADALQQVTLAELLQPAEHPLQFFGGIGSQSDKTVRKSQLLL